MGKKKKWKNGCRIVNKQLYFYKSNKQFFYTFYQILRVVCLRFWEFYQPNGQATQTCNWAANCLASMKIVFFFPVFFFFSFYLLFLLKPSPIFFISSFLSPTGFSVPHKHLTATPSGPLTPPPVTAATWIYLHDHFYSILNLW